MADVQITSAELKDGVLTITGSGFTRTTTTVKVDDEDHTFTVNEDSTEITVEDVEEGAESVTVTKGSVTAEYNIEPAEGQGQPAFADSDQSAAGSAEEPYKTATPNTTPGDISKDDEQTTSNVSEEDLAAAGNAGAEVKSLDANAPDREPLQPGQPLPGADFRTKVENTAAGDLNWDPKQPYPVGNPPDERESFHRMHGFYKDDKASEGTP